MKRLSSLLVNQYCTERMWCKQKQSVRDGQTGDEQSDPYVVLNALLVPQKVLVKVSRSLS